MTRFSHLHNRGIMQTKRYADLLIGILPSAAWILPLLLCEPLSLVLALLCAVLVHEAGHLAAFFAVGVGAPSLSGSFFGFILMPSRQLSYKQELLVAAAGPFFNLAFAFFLLIFKRSEGASLVAGMNIGAALYNLLPVSTLDGGRIVFSFFCMIFEYRTALSVCRAISFFCLCFILFFSLWLILFHDIGYRIFFSIMLIAAASDKNQR